MYRISIYCKSPKQRGWRRRNIWTSKNGRKETGRHGSISSRRRHIYRAEYFHPHRKGCCTEYAAFRHHQDDVADFDLHLLHVEVRTEVESAKFRLVAGEIQIGAHETPSCATSTCPRDHSTGLLEFTSAHSQFLAVQHHPQPTPDSISARAKCAVRLD